jgi:hypothetical protein
MAEWLVKTYKPQGFAPGARPGDGDLALVVSGESVIIDYAFLSVTSRFLWRDEEIRTIHIRTEILTQRVDPHYSAGSAKLYLDADYNSSILKMKSRIMKYCSEQVEIGYVLSQFAANDHLHPFWKPRLFNRVRGLSF